VGDHGCTLVEHRPHHPLVGEPGGAFRRVRPRWGSARLGPTRCCHPVRFRHDAAEQAGCEHALDLHAQGLVHALGTGALEQQPAEERGRRPT
jgi:hypothetical protein